MARKIVATGRGGAGKSSFAALVSRYLKHLTLFVDFDPKLIISNMLGFDISKEGHNPQNEIASCITLLTQSIG